MIPTRTRPKRRHEPRRPLRAWLEIGRHAQPAIANVLRAVRLQLDLAAVQVGMEQAIPCGLIVNELVSNGLEHGVPNGEDGEVRVALGQPQPRALHHRHGTAPRPGQSRYSRAGVGRHRTAGGP